MSLQVETEKWLPTSVGSSLGRNCTPSNAETNGIPNYPTSDDDKPNGQNRRPLQVPNDEEWLTPTFVSQAKIDYHFNGIPILFAQFCQGLCPFAAA